MSSTNKHFTTLIEREGGALRFEYEITYEFMPHESLKKLPRQVREQLKDLQYLHKTQPEQAIVSLLDLIERYPKVPIFYNYLIAAYNATGQPEKAEAAIEEAYQKHPDYHFAKTNYAMHCLRNQAPEKIPAIFDNKFDLGLLYPHRKVFHITELMAFTGVMTLYYNVIGNSRGAEVCYTILQELEPEHYLTKSLKRQLYPTFFQKLWDTINKPIQKKLYALKQQANKKTASKSNLNNFSKEF
jgi:tetratricopeptide (TPR) repeat protein